MSVIVVISPSCTTASRSRGRSWAQLDRLDDERPLAPGLGDERALQDDPLLGEGQEGQGFDRFWRAYAAIFGLVERFIGAKVMEAALSGGVPSRSPGTSRVGR